MMSSGIDLTRLQPGINRLSIRHDELIAPKPQDIRRMIYLGDSLAWANPGFVTYTRDTIVGDTHTEVINASVPGYTTYQELLFLRQYVIQAEPDLIILAFCLNDNHKFLHQFDERGNMLITREASDYMNINSPIDWLASKSYVLSRIKFGLINYYKQDSQVEFPWQDQIDMRTSWEEEPWDNTEYYLAEIEKLLTISGAKFMIVIFPLEAQLSEDLLAKNYDYVVKPQSRFMHICKIHEIPCLDLFSTFHQRSHDKHLYKDGLHLSEDGHRIAAAEILQFGEERTLSIQVML